MSDFVMPSLGADMEAGTLLEWRVKPGDMVSRGDIVAVVDTSKAEIEIEIFEDGVVEELLVEEGTKVPVGEPLAKMRSADGAGLAPLPAPAREQVAAAEPAPPPPASTAAPPAPAPAAPAPIAPTSPAPEEPERRPRVSPLARRTAEQLHVDLAEVEGSGPSGSIVQADVERAAGTPTEQATPVASPPEPPAPAESAPPSHQEAMRKAIGALMARSKREIPHYYLEHQIEMTRAMAWLEEQNRERGVAERLLPSVLLLSAVAKAAAKTPALNGFWVDERFRPAPGVHLGVAISLRGGGLVAPAIHDADEKNLDRLMAELRDLVNRAREGRLRSSEMSDPTLTVTNLGERGADLVHGVIYPPQVALVGFGAVRTVPWATGGMIGAKPAVTATLAADHRQSDGHAGSRFLALIDHLLQEPEEL